MKIYNEIKAHTLWKPIEPDTVHGFKAMPRFRNTSHRRTVKFYIGGQKRELTRREFLAHYTPVDGPFADFEEKNG
jgi:hypothetical protein